MPTTFSDGLASTLVFGRGSHLKFAEQTTSGTAITDPASFSKYNVAVNSMTVAPTTTLLTPGVIPTTVEQFIGVPGPQTIAGNFVIDGLPNRMELFFRQLLNAPSSAITDTAAVAQTLLAAGTDITSLPSSIPVITDYPGQISITLASGTIDGSTAPSSGTPLVFTLQGEDVSGNALTDTISFASATGTETSSDYFNRINSITFSPSAATGTITMSASSGRNTIEIQSEEDYRITPGLTVEAVNGTVPNTITDAYLNSFSFNATREEIITYTFGLTGRLFAANVNPAGASTAFSTRSGGTLYGSGAFETIQDGQSPFAGYSACVYAKDGPTTDNFLMHTTSFSLTFDNNTQFTDRLCGITPGVPYNRQRTATVELTLEYHSDDTDFARAYLAADTWNDVNLILTESASPTAIADQTRFIFNQIQFTEYPSIPIESDDFVRQTVRGIALPSSGENVDAVKIECRQDSVTTSTIALTNLS